MNFLENLNSKLTYATEAKLISLPTLAETEVTTANTVVDVANYSAVSANSFDTIESTYVFSIGNDSGTNEAFTSKILVGATQVGSATATVNNLAIAECYCKLSAVKVGTNYVINVTISHAGVTVVDAAVIPVADFTGFTFNTKNDTTAAAGCTVTGLAGYVLLDNVERI